MSQGQQLAQTHTRPSRSVKAILFMPHRWFRHKADEFEQFTIDVIMGRREGVAAMLFGTSAFLGRNGCGESTEASNAAAWNRGFAECLLREHPAK